MSEPERQQDISDPASWGAGVVAEEDAAMDWESYSPDTLAALLDS